VNHEAWLVFCTLCSFGMYSIAALAGAPVALVLIAMWSAMMQLWLWAYWAGRESV
jgi:hypothetical protein